MSKPVVDFDNLAFLNTATFPVPRPNGKGTVGNIIVAGPGHDQVLAFEEAEHRRKFDEDEAHARARFEAVKAGEPVPPHVPFKTQEELREMGARKLASYVVDADFDVKLGGKTVPLNSETAFQIFKEPSFAWIVAPLWEFVNSRENFTANSADS